MVYIDILKDLLDTFLKYQIDTIFLIHNNLRAITF